MFLLTSPVLILRAPPAAPSPTVASVYTSTTNPPNPPTRDPRPRRSTRDRLSGKGKRPDPRDVPRRKSMPRTAKKKQKTISLVPTMAHTRAKAADGKPVAGRSPTEVDQAFHDRSLPEEHNIAICALANSPKPHELKKLKNPSSQDPRHSTSLSPPTLAFLNPPLSPILPYPSKPTVNPYLSYPSSTNDSHSNELKPKKENPRPSTPQPLLLLARYSGPSHPGSPRPPTSPFYLQTPNTSRIPPL